MSHRKTFGLGVGLAVWVGCVAAGFAALQHYSAKAGPAGAPAEAGRFFAAHRHAGRPLLVMAVHPRCPCSDASLAELGDLLARSRGSCDALLLQYYPDIETPGWPDNTAPRELGGVPVKVLLDRGGRIAATLGAVTSGHAVFADARGAVRFAGGLTVARGHRGRSPAQDAILALLGGGTAALTAAPVYGCTLNQECATALPHG